MKYYSVTGPQEKGTIEHLKMKQIGSLTGPNMNKEYKITTLLHLEESRPDLKFRVVFKVAAQTEAAALEAVTALGKDLVQMKLQDFKDRYVEQKIPVSYTQMYRESLGSSGVRWVFSNPMGQTRNIVLDEEYMRRIDNIVGSSCLKHGESARDMDINSLKELLEKTKKRKLDLMDRYLKLKNMPMPRPEAEQLELDALVKAVAPKPFDFVKLGKEQLEEMKKSYDDLSKVEKEAPEGKELKQKIDKLSEEVGLLKNYGKKISPLTDSKFHMLSGRINAKEAIDSDWKRYEDDIDGHVTKIDEALGACRDKSQELETQIVEETEKVRVAEERIAGGLSPDLETKEKKNIKEAEDKINNLNLEAQEYAKKNYFPLEKERKTLAAELVYLNKVLDNIDSSLIGLN